MTDYFRDLVARHQGWADFAEPVVSHPFTGNTPAKAARSFNQDALVNAPQMPTSLSKEMKILEGLKQEIENEKPTNNE